MLFHGRQQADAKDVIAGRCEDTVMKQAQHKWNLVAVCSITPLVIIICFELQLNARRKHVDKQSCNLNVPGVTLLCWYPKSFFADEWRFLGRLIPTRVELLFSDQRSGNHHSVWNQWLWLAFYSTCQVNLKPITIIELTEPEDPAGQGLVQQDLAAAPQRPKVVLF